ncbi:MAG: RidA family protein [Mesorhizobium sp.]
MLTAINPQGLSSVPFYSQGIEARNVSRHLYISGQVGVAEDGSVPADLAGQAVLASANLNKVLAGAGMTSDNLVKVTIYLTDETRIGEFMQAGAGALPKLPPATTLLIVKALAAPNLLVEIEGIAVA